MTQRLRVVPQAQRGVSDKKRFSYEEMCGRLCEIQGAAPALTFAVQLIREAQANRQPVAFVSSKESTFYIPDLISNGIDLESLVCIQTDTARFKNAIARSADHLLRSGAFGLVLLDMHHEKRHIPMPLLTRLSGLCRKHECATLFLRSPQRAESGLGSLISLRLEVERDDDETLIVTSIKDKRQAPYQSRVIRCVPPPGFKRRTLKTRELTLVGKETSLRLLGP